MKQVPPSVSELTELVDLGDNHYISWLSDSDGNKIGFLEWHDCKRDDQFLTAGTVMFDIPEAQAYQSGQARWQLYSLDPIHVEPSIACRSCSNHGFIRNGKWVNA